MAIAFPSIPLPFLPPLYYADIVPGQAPFSASLKCLLIGQKNHGAPGQENVPIILSGSEAERLYGRGSMLARMYARARDNAPFAEFWGMAVPPQDGAIAAQGAIKVLSDPTIAGILNLSIAGYRIAVPVSVGTAANQALRVRGAINAATNCPVTAAIDGGDSSRVILTCKWRGQMGNQIRILKGSFGVQNSIDNLFQITGMTGVTVGVGAMVLTTGLGALGNRRFDVFASPARPGNSDFMDGISGRWSPLQQLYGHWFTSINNSFSGLITTGLTLNDPHLSILGTFDSPTPAWEWAAAYAAHATAHWAEPPELSRPLQTLKLRGVEPPWNRANAFSIAEQQSLLDAGISTYIPDDAGDVHIGRVVTTRRVNDWGDPDPSWRDAVTMFQTMYFARRMRAAVTGAFPRAALSTRDTGIPGFASPPRIKDLYIQEYMKMQKQGLVENSELFAQSLVVERNANDPNRVDSLIRPDFVNQLRIVANLIETHLELDNPRAA